LAPAFAFRCLSSLRCEGHLSASCPAPNANVHFTFKRDLVYFMLCWIEKVEFL